MQISFFSQIKNKIKKSEFLKNVLFLTSGTLIARFIQIAISPILTRMYTPSDFGVLGLFIAISSILGIIANGRYDVAILLPKDDDESINLASIGIIISMLISILTFLAILIWHDQIVSLINNIAIAQWLYLIPLVIFLIGIYNIFNYLNIRFKKYKNIAKASVYKSISASSVQLFLGIFNTGTLGLISGSIASNFSGNILLGKEFIKRKPHILIKTGSLRKVAKRYIDFPKYSLWAILANTLGRNMNSILLSNLYTISTVGYYALLERVLGMPSILIGQSFGQVFFQKATEEKNNTGSAIKTFNSTTKRLILISVPAFIILFLFSKKIFTLFFGEEWEIAGEYAQILLPFFAIRFVVSPLSTINYIFEKQTLELKWQVGLLILTIFIFFICKYFELDVKTYFYLTSFILSIHYLLLWYLIRRVTLGKN